MAEFKLFHVDDCMYVAGADADAVRAHVRQACGADCAWSVEEVSRDLRVTRANVEDGEEATPDTMTTAGVLIEEHLAAGGVLPYTICFDAGM